MTTDATGQLRAQAQKLLDVTEKLKEVSARQNLQAQLETRQENLKTAQVRVNDAVTSWRGLAALDLRPSPSTAERAGKVAALVRDVRRKFNADSSHLLANDFRLAMDAVDKVATPARDEFREAWQARVDALTPTFPDVVLDVLSAQPSQAVHVKKLRAVVAQLRPLRTQYPVAAAHLHQFKSVQMELVQAQRGLASADVPADVLAFLEASRGGGSPLYLLTGHVLDWLTAHQLTHAFVVTRR